MHGLIPATRSLNPGNKEPDKIEKVLKKSSVKELKRYPVSKLVNQVGNNKKECMEPLKGGND